MNRPHQLDSRQTGRDRRYSYVLLIVLFGTLFRAIYHIAYRPVWSGDSAGYTGPFYLWVHGHFSDGARAPMYPLFLGLAQGLVGAPASLKLSSPAAYCVTALQSLLGLISACLLYDTLRVLCVRARLAFAAGLLFAVTGGICQFELNILTESLSVFAVMSGTWLYVRTMRRVPDASGVGKLAVITGVVFACAALIRAELLVFFVVVVAFTIALWAVATITAGHSAQSRSLLKLCLVLPLSGAPLILAWMTCNYIGLGEFRITTITGYQVNQAVYNLFDRVEPKDRVLGQIMMKYYREQNRGGVIVRDYLWSGVDDLVAHANQMPIKKRSRPGATGAVQIDLGDYIEEVSLNLARRYPLVYLRNVADTFVHDTFKFTYHQTAPMKKIEPQTDPQSVNGKDVIRNKGPWRIALWVNEVEAPVLLPLYLITLGWAVFGPIFIVRATLSNDGLSLSGDRLRDATVTALVLGSVGTVVALCMLESFHSQYGVPHLGIFMLCTAYAIEQLVRRAEANRNCSPVRAA